jgi:hypothetical protein
MDNLFPHDGTHGCVYAQNPKSGSSYNSEAEPLIRGAVCSPVRLLNLRTTCSRVGMLPKLAGMVPSKLLLLTSRSVRYIRVPRLAGRVPVSSLDAMARTCKGLLGEKTSGMVPVRLFSPAQPSPHTSATHPLSTACKTYYLRGVLH